MVGSGSVRKVEVSAAARSRVPNMTLSGGSSDSRKIDPVTNSLAVASAASTSPSLNTGVEAMSGRSATRISRSKSARPISSSACSRSTSNPARTGSATNAPSMRLMAPLKGTSTPASISHASISVRAASSSKVPCGGTLCSRRVSQSANSDNPERRPVANAAWRMSSLLSSKPTCKGSS